jgi:putative hydrolase of the HAD superfamily
MKHDLALLSDHAREWIEYIEGVHSFLGVFKARYYSFEIGTLKRDPASFDYVLGKLGIDAVDCLFIDDNARNIGVANTLGINGILFKNAVQLELALPEHGIMV